MLANGLQVGVADDLVKVAETGPDGPNEIRRAAVRLALEAVRTGCVVQHDRVVGVVGEILLDQLNRRVVIAVTKSVEDPPFERDRRNEVLTVGVCRREHGQDDGEILEPARSHRPIV